MSAILNAFARSSTFKPLEKGGRKQLENQPIASQKGYEIIISGPELDEADRDVYLQCLKFYSTTRGAPGTRPNDIKTIFTSEFLKAIKRSVSKNDADWLKASLRRLSQVNVYIKFNASNIRGEYSGSLIDYKSETHTNQQEEISFSIKSNFIEKLHEEYTRVSMEDRLSLKNITDEELSLIGKKPIPVQLAKWLHTYILSHRKPYPIKIKTLKEFSGSAGNLNSFRYRLKIAMNLLKVKGHIAEYKIEKKRNRDEDLIYIYRNNKDIDQHYILPLES
jgi:hypothetical protein